MKGSQNQGSEVARLLKRISEEYESAQLGLTGLASGTSKHEVITCRMENMGKLHEELHALVGDESIEMMIQQLDRHNAASTSVQ